MVKIIRLALLFVAAHAIGQNSSKNQDDSLQLTIITRCFENLNQGSELFEQYQQLKAVKFCSIIECSLLLSYEEQELKKVAELRLKDIAKQLFNEGTPVYLTKGYDSFSDAEQANKNLDDDDHIRYVSLGASRANENEKKVLEVFNGQTNELLGKKPAIKK